jgi:hypothetical protein
MAKVTRSVQYRYLDRERFGLVDGSLASILRRGLRVKRNGDIIGEKARARIADLDQVGQLTLLNGIKGLDENGPIAGELLLYRQGFDVPAIAENLDSEENRFETQMFKTDGKNKPIMGALYFAALGDHVGVIASKAVNAHWLERYLTWLLKDKCELLDVEDVVSLNASISIDGDEPSRAGEAKGLKIQATGVGNDGRPKTIRKERASGRGGTVLEVLALLGVGPDAIESIKNDIPEGGKLEGDFQVYIKEGRKRQPMSMGTLDHTLRNLDPDDVSIERKGSKSRGRLLFLSEPVRVTEGPAGLEPNEAIELIIDQLYRWGRNGTFTIESE